VVDSSVLYYGRFGFGQEAECPDWLRSRLSSEPTDIRGKRLKNVMDIAFHILSNSSFHSNSSNWGIIFERYDTTGFN